MKVNPVGTQKLFSVGGSASNQPTRARARAAATATIEPHGPRTPGKREHRIKVVIELDQADAKHADKNHIAATTRRALAAWAGESDRCEIREVTSSKRDRAGVTTTSIVAVEGQVIWPNRPSANQVDALSSALLGEGYRVNIQERRECLQSTCTTDAMVEWNQSDEHPKDWTTTQVCGKHHYKPCAECKSTYLMTSVNAAGQATSVHCQVCNAVLIEWGSSKVWEAELVTRGDGAVAAVAARNKRKRAG